MGQKDIISKQLIKRIVIDLAVYLLKLAIQPEDLELLATEQQRVEERRADVVAKVNQSDQDFILHIEIQNNNDLNMPLRMLRYYTDIGFAHPELPIHQYVIYIGCDKLSMPVHKHDHGLDYRYTIIDMHTIDYQDLLNQDSPDAMVLAILGDFKNHSNRQAVNDIVLQLHRKLKSQPQRFRDYLYMLEILSENRALQPYIKEAETVITQVNIENMPSFELGMEKGIEKGIEKGLQKGIEQGIEKGMEKIIRQLLSKQSPEMVSKLTELPLDVILGIQQKIEH